MNYVMHILSPTNIDNRFDVSELVHDITFSTSLAGQPGKLTFQLEKDTNNILKLELGYIVEFWDNDVDIFKGYIFNIGTDGTGVYQIIAYDQMRYLANHDSLVMDNMTVPDLFIKICKNTELEYQIKGKATIDVKRLPSHNFVDESYFNMFEYAINKSNTLQVEKLVVSSVNTNVTYTVKSGDTLSDIAYQFGTTAEKLALINGIKDVNFINVGQILYLSEGAKKIDTAELVNAGTINYFRYFIKDEFGKLTLNDIDNNIKHKVVKENNYEYVESNTLFQPLIIGDESLLTSYRYEMDIDKNTYNELYLVKNLDEKTDDGKNIQDLVYSVQDEETIKKWGKLRKIKQINDNATMEQIEDYAKLSLTEGATINKTLRLEAIGFNGVNAGDGFILRLNKLGINMLMYVVSATHNYNADNHTMSLEVCTPSNLVEVL